MEGNCMDDDRSSGIDIKQLDDFECLCLSNL